MLKNSCEYSFWTELCSRNLIIKELIYHLSCLIYRREWPKFIFDKNFPGSLISFPMLLYYFKDFHSIKSNQFQRGKKEEREAVKIYQKFPGAHVKKKIFFIRLSLFWQTSRLLLRNDEKKKRDKINNHRKGKISTKDRSVELTLIESLFLC